VDAAATADAAALTILAQIQQRNQAYDTATAHGTTAGASFP
jgi:hypothetical protein